MKNRIFMALILAFSLAIAAFAAPSMLSVETADEAVLYLCEQDNAVQTSTNLVPILRKGDPVPEKLTASLASDEEADIIVSDVLIHSFYAGTKTVTAEVQFEYAARGMHDAKTKLIMSIVDDNGKAVAKQKSCEVVFSQYNYDVSLMYELEAVPGHTFSDENRYFLEFEYTGAYTFENNCYFSQLIASASQEIIKMETVNVSQNIVDFYMANVDKDAELVFVIDEVEYPSEKIADGVYRVHMTELEYRSDGDMPNTMWLFIEVYDSEGMHICFGNENYYYIGKDSPEYEDWNRMEFQKVIPLNAQSAYVYLESKENGDYYKQNEMSKISAVIYDAVTCQKVGASRSTDVSYEEGAVFVDVLITAPIVSDRKYVMVVDDGYTIRTGNMKSLSSPYFENVMLMRNGSDEHYYDIFPAETFRMVMTNVYYMPDLTKLQVKILDNERNLYAQSYGTVSVYGQNPDRTSYDYIQFGMQTVGELTEGEYYLEVYYDDVRIDNDEFRFYYYPGYGYSEGVMMAGAYNDGQYTYVGMIVYNGDFNARNASYTLVSNYSSYGDTVSGTLSRVVFENDWETFVVAKFPVSEYICWDYHVEMVDGGTTYVGYGFESDYAGEGYVYNIGLYNDEGKMYFAGDNLSDNKTYKIMMFENRGGKAVEFPLTKVRGKNELVFGVSGEEFSKYDIFMDARVYITADGKIISAMEAYDVIYNNGFYNSGHDFYARYRRLNHRIAILALPYADYVSYRIAESESELKNSAYTSMKNYTEYIVSEGSGKKVIYAQFKDSRGKESEIMRTYVYVDVKAPVLEVASVTQNVEINEYGSVYINGELTTDEDGYLFVEFYDEEDKRIDIGNSYFDDVDARDGLYFFGNSINVGAENSPLVNASKIKLYIVDYDGNKSNVVEFAFSAVHGYSLYEKDGVKIVLENDTGYIKKINTSNPRILIPEQIGGVDVKGIKDYVISVSANIDITYIRLPKSLEYFGYEAFYGVWNATYGVYENSPAHATALERGYNFELVTLAPGDISGDETIDDTDVKTVAEYIISVFTSVETLTEEQIKAADVYKGDAEEGETVINIKDLIALAQMARGHR